MQHGPMARKNGIAGVGENLTIITGMAMVKIVVIFGKLQVLGMTTEHLFAGEVIGLVELGITQGCSTGRFCPNESVTRGQMAAFLTRALDLNSPTNMDSFDDDDGSIFENDIEALYAAGITRGCSTDSFCPSSAVSRGEMAAFLVRAFDLPESSGDSFSDDDRSFFEADIAALQTSGVTSGCSTGRFCPDRPVSRQEMAAFLIRALALN